MTSQLELPTAPLFKVNTLLVCIRRTWRPHSSDEELYEVTRAFWRVSADTRERTEQVFGFENWTIRSGYMVDGWFPSPGLDARGHRRWGFEGYEHPDIDQYAGTSVQDHFEVGAHPHVRKVFVDER